MNSELKGKRIILKKHNVKLAKLMFEAIDKDRARLGKHLPWVKHTKTWNDSKKYILETQKDWKAKTSFDYGIFLKDGSFIGNAGFHTIDHSQLCLEIGYWISGEHEGKGYMSEAVTLLEKEAFKQGFKRIEIRCSESNKRSKLIPIRLGYVLDGVLRSHRLENGRRRSTYVFSKLKTDKSKVSTLVSVDHMILYTDDPAKLKFWYEKVFHTKAERLSPHFYEMRFSHGILCICKADEMSLDKSTTGYWLVNNLENMMRQVIEKEGKIYRGPLEIGNGQKICQVLDPSGNIIGLIEGPSV